MNQVTGVTAFRYPREASFPASCTRPHSGWRRRRTASRSSRDQKKLSPWSPESPLQKGWWQQSVWGQTRLRHGRGPCRRSVHPWPAVPTSQRRWWQAAEKRRNQDPLKPQLHAADGCGETKVCQPWRPWPRCPCGRPPCRGRSSAPWEAAA